MTMKTKAKATIPDDAVLLIPAPEIGESPTCGIRPGYYNSKEMLDLIDQHKNDSRAIQFIADMLETGDAESDGFAVMLRNNRSNPKELARIIQICKEP